MYVEPSEAGFTGGKTTWGELYPMLTLKPFVCVHWLGYNSWTLLLHTYSNDIHVVYDDDDIPCGDQPHVGPQEIAEPKLHFSRAETCFSQRLKQLHPDVRDLPWLCLAQNPRTSSPLKLGVQAHEGGSPFPSKTQPPICPVPDPGTCGTQQA